MKNLYQSSTIQEKLFLYAGPENTHEDIQPPTVDLKTIEAKMGIGPKDIDMALAKINNDIKDAHATLADQYNIQQKALSKGIALPPENQITQNPNGSYTFNELTLSENGISGKNVFYDFTFPKVNGQLLGRFPGKGTLTKDVGDYEEIIAGAVTLEDMLTEQEKAISSIGDDITTQMKQSNRQEMSLAEAQSREEENPESILNELP